ncbi:hypothetical protein Poly30_28260 [Planctomycetes bacterium Poly30]|uniref:Protein CR006 P-loop domain-containing protein n=1 Tax=Saltatorellus ferox TaxID=2528018 RepID=A0A518ET96_9BACT|nr:hypothetical protein Poly30_28260 [Planctomycetes bacterium Poly30]
MIKQFKYINNLGRFETFKGCPKTALRPLTLVYSENGRGKTTLCALLRSLSTGDPEHLQARKRVSAEKGPHAVVTIDGAERSFDGEKWSGTGPKVLVFDDHFTAANVCSGLEVAAGHRQGLHELVVGEEGVRLQRTVEELTVEISEHQTLLRGKAREIPQETLGAYSLDDFCALAEIDNIDEELQEAGKSASVLRDQEKIRTTGEFTAIAMPTVPSDEVRAVLAKILPDLDAAALAAVSAHFKHLGDKGERWVSEGSQFQVGESCPYCGQETDGVQIVAHYRRYFSDAYAKHKEDIARVRTLVGEAFDGDRLARFQRLVEQARERRGFWVHYIEGLPAFDVDAGALAAAWAGARDALLVALESKSRAPLDRLALDDADEAKLTHYTDFSDRMLALSTALLDMNEAIAAAKEHATHGNLAAAEAQLSRLQATQRRYEPEVAAKCTAYRAAKTAKDAAETKKEDARKALDEHRKNTFGKYQGAINKFLDRFNADFRLEALEPSDPRGIPSSTYALGVNKGRVPLANRKVGPSFSTALSAGDRNTLALALFFATLTERDSLDDVTVVIDDPVSSLDDGRCFATVQEIRKLLGKAKQVIVLSHARPFLCQLWDRADKGATATIELRDVDTDSSTLQPWDAEAAAVTEYDRLYKTVSEYAECSQGDSQVVAPSLRKLLEGYSRVAFVERFPAGCLLGKFIDVARQAERDGTPLLSNERLEELDDLRDYTNQFHHNTSKTWQENLANINETQLKGYAGRVIRFVRGE